MILFPTFTEFAIFISVTSIPFIALIVFIIKSNIENNYNEKKDKNFFDKIYKIFYQKINVINIIIVTLSTIISAVTTLELPNILQSINIWGSITFIPIIAFILYFVRSRIKKIYGIIEITVGFVTALRIFIPALNPDDIPIQEFLQFIGGIYIIIRGLDNFENGLKDGKFKTKWKKFFKGKHTI